MSVVTIVVDAREADRAFLPRGDVGRLVETLRALESALSGAVLRANTSFTVEVTGPSGDPLGQIAVEVISPPEARVDAGTEFAVVAVRERAHVPATRQCAACARSGRVTFGPFECGSCPDDARHVCDEHVVLLPGSLRTHNRLTATCPDHHPVCSECGATAIAWCPGPACRSQVAWCARHLVVRDPGPDQVRYCVSCHDTLFPSCGEPGCSAVGSMSCQHLDDSGRFCGVRVCPRHATLWQVFGPQRQGLVRCREHSRVSGLLPQRVMYQVLGACTQLEDRSTGQRRTLHPPSLPGLRYIVMKASNVNPSMAQTLAWAESSPQDSPALRRQIGEVVAGSRRRWRDAAAEVEAGQATAEAKLREWLIGAGRREVADAFVARGWARPRVVEGRQVAGKLFIQADARYFPLAARQRASADLGFEVRLERRD